MTLVIVESPFMFKSENEDERIIGQLRNITYARLALHDCFLRNESPYASHLLFTQPFILNDDIPEERDLGINAGLYWGDQAELTALYRDLGESSGMKYGRIRAEKANRRIDERNILGWENALEQTPMETLVSLGLYSKHELEKLIEMKKDFTNAIDTFSILSR